VAHKMSNATAMMRVGLFSKKQYSWLNTPSVSSPLAGKKRKKGKRNEGEDGESGGEGSTVPAPSSADYGEEVKPELGVIETDAAPPQKKSKSEKGSKKKAVLDPSAIIPPPTRRSVLVDPGRGGLEKRVSDERAVTVMDVLFALDREGRGMGTSDEVLMRARALGLGIVDREREGEKSRASAKR